MNRSKNRIFYPKFRKMNFLSIFVVTLLIFSCLGIFLDNDFSKASSAEKTVLVIDPNELDILNYITGGSNTFWDDFDSAFSDVSVVSISPISSLSNKISSNSPDVIIISDVNLWIWGLDANNNYEAVKDFADSGGGLIITHGTFFDLLIDAQAGIIPIGPCEHIGLETDYSVKFDGLSTLTGLGLLPVYEQLKMIIADLLKAGGVTTALAPIARGMPLCIPYIPFDGVMEAEDANDPILNDISLSSGKFNLDIDCPMCKGKGDLDTSFDCWLCGGDGMLNGEECQLCHGHGHFGEYCVACSGTGMLTEGVECTPCGGTGVCTHCSGAGNITCDTCDGDGQIDCETCGGDGQVTCDTCSGTGKITCELCSGDGKIDCETCGGDGKNDCIICGGDGQIECEFCNGDGCLACGYRGWFGCSGCGGFGDSEGRGWNGCSICGGLLGNPGSGLTTCTSCLGAGWNVCPDCLGVGDVTCIFCLGNGKCSLCGGDGYTVDPTPCPFCGGDGAPDSYECFFCDGSGKNPYTMVGWQLEYPEIIVNEALQNFEATVDEASELFSPITYEFNELTGGSFSSVDNQNVKDALLESSKNLREFFDSLLNARSELPDINIHIPEMNIGDETIPARDVTITLPSEIAETICSVLKPAEIVAISTDSRAAILKYESPTHRAVYFSFKPESTSNSVNKQLMYNAVTWTSQAPPELLSIADMIVPENVKNAYDELQGLYQDIPDILDTSGFVTAGGSSIEEITIHSPGTLVAILTSPSNNLQFKLVSPSQEEYTSTSKGVGNEVIEVNNPESGTWRTVIESTSNTDAIYGLYRLEMKEGVMPALRAYFTYSPQNPTALDEITFMDTSTATESTIISWSWDFGDGTTSTQQNPSHQYSNSGTYTVSLEITDDNETTDSISRTVTIQSHSTTGDGDDGTSTDESGDDATPGFELIFAVISVAIVLFWKRKRY